MSVDWTTVCDKCKLYRHLGQFMGGVASFGWGSQDEEGREESADFVDKHVYHTLRIVRTDDIPEDYTESKWEGPDV